MHIKLSDLLTQKEIRQFVNRASKSRVRIFNQDLQPVEMGKAKIGADNFLCKIFDFLEKLNR